MAPQSGGQSGAVGSCPACASANQTEFDSEMIIHFSGPRYIDNPGVPQAPKILVCTDCGFARLTLPDDARTQLVQALRKSGPARARVQGDYNASDISPLDMRQ